MNALKWLAISFFSPILIPFQILAYARLMEGRVAQIGVFVTFVIPFTIMAVFMWIIVWFWPCLFAIGLFKMAISN